MIKKWGNFINENFLQEAKKKVSDGFIGEKEINGIFTEEFANEVRILFRYTEYRYSQTSAEIRNFLNEVFPGSRWTDGWISLGHTFSKNSYGDKTIAIIKIVDFLEKIRPEIGADGYPVKSELSNKIESICMQSLDGDVVELFEVREEWNGIYVELGYNANLTTDKFLLIGEELVPMKDRIIQIENTLKETELIFTQEGNITIIFEHN